MDKLALKCVDYIYDSSLGVLLIHSLPYPEQPGCGRQLRFAVPNSDKAKSDSEEEEEEAAHSFTRIVQTKFSDEVIEIGMKSEEESMGKLTFINS